MSQLAISASAVQGKLASEEGVMSPTDVPQGVHLCTATCAHAHMCADLSDGVAGRASAPFSRSHTARTFLTPKIAMLAAAATGCYAGWMICVELLGETSALAIMVSVLLIACGVLFSISIWINMDPSLLRMLLHKPRYAAHIQSSSI